MGARIPIVRFVHEESDLKCDLSFHNMMSVMNSKFLKMCQQADPRYVPDLFLRGSFNNYVDKKREIGGQ